MRNEITIKVNYFTCVAQEHYLSITRLNTSWFAIICRTLGLEGMYIHRRISRVSKTFWKTLVWTIVGFQVHARQLDCLSSVKLTCLKMS